MASRSSRSTWPACGVRHCRSRHPAGSTSQLILGHRYFTFVVSFVSDWQDSVNQCQCCSIRAKCDLLQCPTGTTTGWLPHRQILLWSNLCTQANTGEDQWEQLQSTCQLYRLPESVWLRPSSLCVEHREMLWNTKQDSRHYSELLHQ